MEVNLGLNMKLVFVYGSLKHGMTHHNLLQGQRYVGVALTAPRYAMFQLSGYPALIDSSDGKRLWGELYEVTDDCVSAMDRLEGVNQDIYERRQVELDELHPVRLPRTQEAFALFDSKKADCYFYRQSVEGARNCGSFWAV